MIISVWKNRHHPPIIDIEILYTEKYLKSNWPKIADRVALFIDSDLKAQGIHLGEFTLDDYIDTKLIVQCNRHPEIACAMYGRIAERIGIKVPKIEDMEETK